MNGQVIRVISNLYTVKIDDQLYGCHARGKFRKENITPMVGDNVIVDTDNNIIVKILPRKNELSRPVVANVDMALIVTSVRKPNLDLTLLDKLISIITINKTNASTMYTLSLLCFSFISFLLFSFDFSTFNSLLISSFEIVLS